mgnify:CR=1 FL=1
MKKTAIIGHVDHGKTTLTVAIQSVLDKEQVVIHGDWKKEEEKVYEYTNPYHRESKIKPNASKSRLRKCQKGIHEYAESERINVSKNFFKSEWNCIHCGASMRVP